MDPQIKTETFPRSRLSLLYILADVTDHYAEFNQARNLQFTLESCPIKRTCRKNPARTTQTVQVCASLRDEEMICRAVALVRMKRNMEMVSIFSVPMSIRLAVALPQTGVAFCGHRDETLVVALLKTPGLDNRANLQFQDFASSS